MSYNILFLCTGNSARSIMAEALLNHRGQGAFNAYSAGSHPSGAVRPEAIHQLQEAGIATAGLRSKSWDEFANATAPAMNIVLTVCDNAAGEVCPFWPGKPVSAHWGVADPAAATGNPEEIARAYRDAFALLDRRIGMLLDLPVAALSPGALSAQLEAIGEQ